MAKIRRRCVETVHTLMSSVLSLTRDLVAQTGCSLLMVTHSTRLAAMLDRHIHLSAGLIA